MLSEFTNRGDYHGGELSDPLHNKSIFIETYGCQMNTNDSEVVVSILKEQGYTLAPSLDAADVILVNTCSIRENAETRVFGRLQVFAQEKRRRPGVLVGVLGCMAERLKEQLLEGIHGVDIVVGPDAYRDLPQLLSSATHGNRAINVLLSREETYADISPVRLDGNGVSAFVSIMRGCNNMCAYCVVPYVRGGERSRDPQSILREVREVAHAGYREVTLLGQNVNSYSWEVNGEKMGFAALLDLVAKADPRVRIRFSTSHPKDISDELLRTMAMHGNICKHIHLPAQSGSTRILELMNRGYSRANYLERIEAIRRILPNCAISTDIIAGFCTETEPDHDQTLSLMRVVGYDFAFMFKYSERPNTAAARTLTDDVPEEVKSQRLTKIIELQNELSLRSKQNDIGKRYEVLIEGVSKKSDDQLFGRTSQNKVVVFPRMNYSVGEYVFVEITSCSSATLKGRVVE